MNATRLPHLMLCAVLAGSLVAGVAAEERMQLDMESFLSRDQPTIHVTGVSARRLFRTFLNKDRFEDYIATSGPDYVLQITHPGLVRELSELLVLTDFEASEGEPEADLRYKLVLKDGDRTIDVVYIGVFGEVLHGKRVFRPKKKDWLSDAWHLLGREVLR